MKGSAGMTQDGKFMALVFGPILWPLTKLCLWGWAILGPIVVILGVIGFIWPDSTGNQFGAGVIFTGQKVAFVIIGLAVSLLGWSYVLHRKQIRERGRATDYVILVLLTGLIATGVSTHYREAYYQRVIGHLEVFDVTLSAVDDQTGQPLLLSVAGPTAPEPYRDIRQLLSSSVTGVSDGKWHLVFQAAWPVAISVGSEGYDTQSVPVKPGISEAVIRLRQLAGSTTSQTSRP
jgi:hypothetical protein